LKGDADEGGVAPDRPGPVALPGRELDQVEGVGKALAGIDEDLGAALRPVADGEGDDLIVRSKDGPRR
jgi:hypothetical protein